MKRVAFLGRGVHTIPTYRALLNELSKNFDVTVFCEVPRQKSWKHAAGNYRLVGAAVRGLPFRVNNVLFFFIVLWYHTFRRYHVIHAHSTYPTGLTAVLLQKIFGTPSIVSLDGGEGVYVGEVKFGDFNSQRRIKLDKWLLKHAMIVNTLTDFHRRMVTDNLGISRVIEVIPRGVDQARFLLKSDLSFARPIRFICVGYLSPIKDHDTLLKAFQKILEHVPATLTIVGEDYRNGEIQKRVASFGIAQHVRFTGNVEHDQMPAIYEQADILLLTSRYESQAMVVVEAMARGILVCGTNVGLIHDLSGVCCASSKVGDPEELARVVIDLINDPQQIHMFRKNAREWSAANTLEQTALRWSEIYRDIIKRRK